jgi:hypothetical protein
MSIKSTCALLLKVSEIIGLILGGLPEVGLVVVQFVHNLMKHETISFEMLEYLSFKSLHVVPEAAWPDAK